MAFKDKTGSPLRDLIESKGEQGAVDVLRASFESKKLSPEDFSLREIWEACEGGASVTEAVTSDAFPKISGELINAKVIAAYDRVPTIGSQLTTTVSSKLKVETIAGFTDVESPDEVPEGHPYGDSTMTEKYVTAENRKYGRLITITEEAIFFDQTGQLLARAARIGEKAAQYKEKIILEGIQDLDSVVYRPSGVPTAFYSTTNKNLITTNSFGESGMEALLLQMHNQKGDAANEDNDDFIYISPDNLIVVVPQALVMEAWQLANSTLTPEGVENASNFFKGKFKTLTSPFVTRNSSTTWYAGDFKSDFWWTEVWPLQTLSAKPGNDDEFNKDIKSKHKVRFFGGIVGVETKHSYKCTA